MLGLSFSGQKREAKERPEGGSLSQPAPSVTPDHTAPTEKPLGAFDALAVPRPQPAADPSAAAAGLIDRTPDAGSVAIPSQNPSDIINALTKVEPGEIEGGAADAIVANNVSPPDYPSANASGRFHLAKRWVCSAPGSLDTSLSHAAGLIEIAACHA